MEVVLAVETKTTNYVDLTEIKRIDYIFHVIFVKLIFTTSLMLVENHVLIVTRIFSILFGIT